MLRKIKKAFALKMLARYKRNKQAAFDPSLDRCLASIRALLKNSKYCFLISQSDNQWPTARMVQPIIDFESLEIWLGTNPTLRKIKEIENNPYVTIAFGNEKENANLIVYGKANIIHDDDSRKKHWLGSWRLFFPGGPTSDDFVSIKVEPQKIELMDFQRNLVDEPFGLKPIKLTLDHSGWQVT